MPIKRARSRGKLLKLGTTYLAEFTQETALDAFCAAVERTHGTVHSIDDYTTTGPDSTGKNRTMRRFAVVVTLPE